MIIGDKIAELRKEKGLTQEQLGALVGVSSQAVSKWENGGTPDVELLPLIADTLGVSLDGLFGREERPGADMSQTLTRYLKSFPPKKRIRELYDLLITSMAGLEFAFGLSEDMQKLLHVMDTAFIKDTKTGETAWMRSVQADDRGILLTVCAEDFPLFLLLPEPEGGYKQNLAPIEDYQRFFSLLGQENSLKLLFWIAGRRQSSYIFASAVAKGVDVSEEETDRLLHELKGLGLLYSIEVETENGGTTAWQLRNSEALLPFLYFARWLMEKSDLYLYTWIQRRKPWLS
ncbi:MAG: helix-turn-helix domain-containing protein [Lachnospiraceae bacterium]|nr:helix-turn-helix domain-containing protein [Lachnospiraceae bacterium]